MKLFAAVLLCFVVAAEARLDFYLGDICKDENRTLWTCKKLNYCPNAQGVRNNGTQTPQCTSIGDSGPIVCCEPQKDPRITITNPSGSKSKEMCKKYAESVFVEEPGPYGVGSVKRDTCTAVEPLITDNRENADPMEYPHMALVGRGDKGSIYWYCGGSLISERFVLSAAQCSELGHPREPAAWVRLGEYNVNSTADDEGGLAQPLDYHIIQRFDYPFYKMSSHIHDITLYKLASEVKFNKYIRPICLQTDHQFPGTYVIATGWGDTKWRGSRSDILQKVNLTVTPRSRCNNDWNSGYGLGFQYGIEYDKMFCAGDIKNGKDTGQGYFGGPLQIRLADPYCMYEQVGIISYSDIYSEGRPAVYTRVSYYMPWIESIVWH